MFQVTGLRLLRQLRGVTLAEVSKSVDCVRGHLSQVERDPTDAGRRLQRKLVTYYDAPWSLLSKRIDASKIADAIVSQATAKKETKYAK
jgi:transcriptional regulator with XRE-family HTH domain